MRLILRTFRLISKDLFIFVLNIQIMCQNIILTAEVIPWELLMEDLQNTVPIDLKVHLKPIANTLKVSSDNKTKHPEKWIKNSLLLTEACLDRTWEMLNSGYWKDVPIEYRYCYSLCIIMKQIAISRKKHKEDKDEKIVVLKNIIQEIDKGILLGAPLPSAPQLLTTLASKIDNHVKTIEILSSKEIHIDDQNISEVIPPGFSEIDFYESPSMESFYKNIFMPKIPAILTGCINHWKALTLWRNANYLTKIAGSRTVPIEIGSRYTEEDWTQSLMKFSEFLNVYISEKNEKIGYLAQHQLFEQIPELKDDFAVPDYCNFSDSEETELPDINAWFGPAKTISPLHYDPKNNLLCQVFGYKKVILYSPDDTSNLYPYETRLLNNTAQVDPMNPDYNKWPNFQNAKGIMCYLKPGEMLYIPPKWWHHVTALSPSFSISFWWN
ncbi:hypothetical protein KM043_002210 [Ampulex compressa]|nr:hypothetical protein KM043_002210 [Ampulex compressa]